MKILNVRLPLEDSSLSPQTLAKLISDDSQHFIFQLPKQKQITRFANDFHQFLCFCCIISKTYTILSVSGICSMKN